MLTDLSFTDIFCRTVLLASQFYFFVLLIVFGFIFLKKETFGRAFFILAFIIILNRFLKGVFQMPLPPGVNPNTWAFPSGHMITATTFWLWISWEYKNKILYVFTTLLLASIGFGLVHCGYHYALDIAGAVFFALVTIVFYHFLVKTSYLQKNPPIIGFILAIIAIPFMLLTENLTKHLSIWLAFGSLLGFACGWLINNKYYAKASTMNLKIKFFILALGLVGLFSIQFLFGLIQDKTFITQGIQFFIIALWLTSVPQYIACRLFCKKV